MSPDETSTEVRLRDVDKGRLSQGERPERISSARKGENLGLHRLLAPPCFVLAERCRDHPVASRSVLQALALPPFSSPHSTTLHRASGLIAEVRLYRRLQY